MNAVTVVLHPVAVQALDELASLGLHGVGRTGVAQRLIEAGLRDAFKQPARCVAVQGSSRCERFQGHTGKHVDYTASGKREW